MSVRILVTGINGQVGGAIMALKDEYPFELIPVSRAEWDMAEEPEKAAELIEQYQPAIVINPAAYTNVDGAEDDQEAAFAVNASAVAELAKACEKPIFLCCMSPLIMCLMAQKKRHTPKMTQSTQLTSMVRVKLKVSDS